MRNKSTDGDGLRRPIDVRSFALASITDDRKEGVALLERSKPVSGGRQAVSN